MSGTLKSAVVWSAAQTIIRLAVGFLSIKITAIYLGATGIALTSQVNNLFGLLRGTIGNAVEDAIVTLTAKENNADARTNRSRSISTATRWILLVSLVLAIIAIPMASAVSGYLLGDAGWSLLIVLLVVVLPLSLLGQLILSVFSGLRRFDLVSLAQIITTVLAAGMLVVSSIAWGLMGGLVATLLTYVIVLFIGVYYARRHHVLKFQDFKGPWDSESWKVIRAYYPMLLVRGAALPLSTLVVRSLMIDRLGTTDAGLWQSALRLSDMYTMIILTALNMYSLPALSAAKGGQQLRKEVISLSTQIIIGMILLAGILFLFREWIVRIVFAAGFEAVGDIWRFQLLADVIQITCIPLRQALMVQRRTAAYIGAELLVAILFVGLVYGLLPRFGIEAATIGSAVAWGISLAALVWLNREVIMGRVPA